VWTWGFLPARPFVDLIINQQKASKV